VWVSVVTIGSAAVLIGAEVFGAAFAGGWALAVLFGLGEYAVYALQAMLSLAGLWVMYLFIRQAVAVEPILTEMDGPGGEQCRASGSQTIPRGRAPVR
jgi:hypothetical protein